MYKAVNIGITHSEFKELASRLRRVVAFAAKPKDKRPDLERVELAIVNGELWARAGNGNAWVSTRLGEFDEDNKVNDAAWEMSLSAAKAFITWASNRSRRIPDGLRFSFFDEVLQVVHNYTAQRFAVKRLPDTVVKSTPYAAVSGEGCSVVAKSIKIDVAAVKLLTTNVPKARGKMRFYPVKGGKLLFAHKVADKDGNTVDDEYGYVDVIDVVADGGSVNGGEVDETSKPVKSASKKPAKAKAKPVKKQASKPAKKPASKPKSRVHTVVIDPTKRESVAQVVKPKPVAKPEAKPVETEDAKPAKVYPLGTRAFTNALLKLMTYAHTDKVVIASEPMGDDKHSVVHAHVMSSDYEGSTLTAHAIGVASVTGTVSLSDVKKAHRQARKLAKSGERKAYSPYLTVAEGTVGLLKPSGTVSEMKGAYPLKKAADGNLLVVHDMAALLKADATYTTDGTVLAGTVVGRGGEVTVWAPCDM